MSSDVASTVLVCYFVGVAALVVVVRVIQERVRARRRAVLARLARTRGWRWTVGDRTAADSLSGPPFDAGYSRTVDSVLAGPYAGWPVVVFDYAYLTGVNTGEVNTVQVHQFTVLAIWLPAALPPLTVGPSRLLDGPVGRAIGFGDLQLESEDFNRAFHVEAGDPRFGHAILHPPMMSYLLATGAWPWRLEGRYLVSYFPQAVSPRAILDRLAAMVGVLERIPAYVWADAGRAAGLRR